MAINGHTDVARNLMLGAYPSNVWLTLHSDDPGETGVNQVPGTPRMPITLGAASGGQRVSADVVEFDLLAGQSVSWVGFWDAASGGNFLSKAPVDPVITLIQDGAIRLVNTAVDLNLVGA